MATVLINAGQCGNQLGFELLEKLRFNLKSDSDTDIFFRSNESGNFLARAVCLDTEPKVVNDCFQKSIVSDLHWQINYRNCVYRHGGAGNNWALGYQMCNGEFLDATMECIYSEIEHCDEPPTLLISHSVGGGTGSGLGTRISEAVSDEFPNLIKVNLAITPYHFGEVVVQYYNTILCLSQIAEASDAVILFENEIAHNICTSAKGISRPSLHDINAVIASSLVPVLLPATCPVSRRPTSLSQAVAHLCCSPAYSFLDVKNVPQTSLRGVSFQFDRWEALVTALRRLQGLGRAAEVLGDRQRHSSRRVRAAGATAGDHSGTIRTTDCPSPLTDPTPPRSGGGVVSVSSSLVLRGEGAREAAESQILAGDPSSSSSGPHGGAYSDNTQLWRSQHVSWAGSSPQKVSYSSEACNGYQRSAALVSNGQAVLPQLDRTLQRAAATYGSGAFLHQYSAYGVERGDFEEAFLRLGQSAHMYRALG